MIDNDEEDGLLRDRVADAAERAAERKEAGRRSPEPSLSSRLGQIGILGWAIVTPVLLGLLVGRFLDHWLHTNITYTAALIMLGAAAGFWSAWRWMHRHG